MSIYTPAPHSKTRVLIGKLILSIPKLLQELTPNGIENSKFNFMKPKSLEEEYLLYRKRRASKYKQNRRAISYGHKNLLMLWPDHFKSFEDFKMCFKPVPEGMPAELMFIMKVCIRHIFTTYCVVYNSNLQSMTLGPEKSYYLQLSELINDLKILEKDYLSKYSYFAMPDIKSIDLIPIYEFIFRALKDEGLEWEYKNENLLQLRNESMPDEEELEDEELDDDDEYNEIKELEEEALKYRLLKIHERQKIWDDYDENDHFLSIDAKRQKRGSDVYGNIVPLKFLKFMSYSHVHDSFQHLGEYPEIADSFEEEIDRLKNLKCIESGKVQAYYNVYGKFPKGYPESEYSYF
ncbi:hypothetical protein [Pedobacter foliorum]|uniref:hypothetical protein n=1 Tax=Pedobacter foliorum TaxID=2739058 RepID=UPI001565FF10|nr:hypothetical protein [Pedobacter foliorum]NRF41835.1 hypothetical protein [Pedobacter foliorum]